APSAWAWAWTWEASRPARPAITAATAVMRNLINISLSRRAGAGKRQPAFGSLEAPACAAGVMPRASGLAWQGEHGQHAAQLGVLRQLAVTADGAKALVVFFQSRRHADAGPAAAAGVHAG